MPSEGSNPTGPNKGVVYFIHCLEMTLEHARLTSIVYCSPLHAIPTGGEVTVFQSSSSRYKDIML